MSFEIQGPKHIAIVGPNGSGKTTLARLIAGHLASDTGDISICGRSIVTLTPQEKAQLVRFVPQASTLFDVSLIENISFPLSSPPEEALVERLFAELDMEGKLSNRLKATTRIGEAAVSGGEAQKILFIRAILNPAPVMVFDEPTSAVDKETSLRMAPLVRELCSNSALHCCAIFWRLRSFSHEYSA